MESSIQIRSHIGTDGILHIEGLYQIADQDVTIILTPSSSTVPLLHESNLDQYAAAPTVGPEVADKLKAISRRFQALPVLDNRSPEEILGYNEIGLPES
jgi:hypothetical protein